MRKVNLEMVFAQYGYIEFGILQVRILVSVSTGGNHPVCVRQDAVLRKRKGIIDKTFMTGRCSHSY